MLTAVCRPTATGSAHSYTQADGNVEPEICSITLCLKFHVLDLFMSDLSHPECILVKAVLSVRTRRWKEQDHNKTQRPRADMGRGGTRTEQHHHGVVEQQQHYGSHDGTEGTTQDTRQQLQCCPTNTQNRSSEPPAGLIVLWPKQ